MTADAMNPVRSRFCAHLKFPALAGMAFSAVVLVPSAAGQVGEDEIWFDGPPYDNPACQGPSELDCQPGADRTVPDVDVDGLARTVVTWQVNDNGGDIYARRFDYSGNALEDPIEVAIDGCGQNDPRVAAGPDGSFVVVWVHTFDPSNVDCPNTRGVNVYSIRSRYFDADGNPGAEQTVSQFDPSFSGGDHQPDVAALAGGGFAVVWRSADVGSGDTNRNIQGRMLSSSGIPSGNQFQINTTTQSAQDDLAIDALPASDPDGPYDGGFLVAWGEPEIHMRRFEADGTSSETDQQVHDQDGERIHLAVSEDGGLAAITWFRSSAIWIRLFDAELNALTTTLQVSSAGDTDADSPSITDIGPEGFYIAWESTTGVGTDNSQSSIQARRLRNDGSFDGGQFQVNTWISNNQTNPRLGSSAGRVGIVWRSAGNPYGQPGDDHILGYLLNYPSCLFCDRFEGDI